MVNKKEPRVSFDSDYTDDEAENTKQIKLDPQKSRFIKKEQQKDIFEQRVSEVQERLQGYLGEALELGKLYNELVDDRTVPDQIGPLRRNREKEIIGKLIAFAMKVNADEDEHEGMGSVSLITLLLKSLLKARDRYNDLDHRYHLLEKHYVALEKKINSLSSQSSSKP